MSCLCVLTFVDVVRYHVSCKTRLRSQICPQNNSRHLEEGHQCMCESHRQSLNLPAVVYLVTRRVHLEEPLDDEHPILLLFCSYIIVALTDKRFELSLSCWWFILHCCSSQVCFSWRNRNLKHNFHLMYKQNQPPLPLNSQ